jgi:hypothetical protein
VGWDQVLEQLTMARNPAELWKFWWTCVRLFSLPGRGVWMW